MATPAAGTRITLTADKLEPLIREETANCTELGIQIGISLSRLQVLERQSMARKPIKECFQEMCYKWLHNERDEDVDRKWCEVYAALKQQGHMFLKAKLEEKYGADATVDQSEFAELLKEMTTEWYLFGCALGISKIDLDIIKGESGSLQDYMVAMLEEWMESKGEKATWEALQEALRAIGNNRTASSLEEHKLKDKQANSN